MICQHNITEGHLRILNFLHFLAPNLNWRRKTVIEFSNFFRLMNGQLMLRLN